ncbi:hypothetical protein AYI70_g5354, partial [Smittium culicis]
MVKTSTVMFAIASVLSVVSATQMEDRGINNIGFQNVQYGSVIDNEVNEGHNNKVSQDHDFDFNQEHDNDVNEEHDNDVNEEHDNFVNEENDN